MRRYLRKKRNFSELEAKTLTSEVERNKEVLFGSIQTGIKRAHKTAVWRRITAAVNRVAVEERTPAEVKKKWSDLKLATKRRVAALKHSGTQTGGAPADPSLPLSPTEEKIASIIASGSVGALSGGGGDAEEVAAKTEKDGDFLEPGGSSSGTAAWSPSHNGDSVPKTEPVSWQDPEDGIAPPAGTAGPGPVLVMAEVQENQSQMCQLLVAVVASLEAINNTLKLINENLKK